MRTITGTSPRASYESEEKFATKVFVNDKLELRVGRGRRARIVELDPVGARQLAYALIETAAKVQSKQDRQEANDKGWNAGFNEGEASAKREAHWTKRKTKRNPKLT